MFIRQSLTCPGFWIWSLVEKKILAKHGHPVAKSVPVAPGGLVLASGKDDPNINHEVLAKDDWWQPMTDEEVDDFIESR